MMNSFPLTFWIVALGFLLHQLLQKVFNYAIAFVDSYFDPFAAAVLGLFILKMERKHLWKQKQISFKWYEIMVITIVLALISEQLFPLLSEEFTSDPFDYIALALGGIYFRLFLNSSKVDTNRAQKWTLF